MSSPDKQFAPASPTLRQLPPLAYGKLRQRHPDYDGKRMQELHDLHAGGWDIQKKAAEYLTQVCNEHERRFAERCKTTAYLGYFGQVVEQFTSDLFAQPLSIMAPADADDPTTPGDPPDEFYKEFEKDCDLRGTAFVDMVKDVMSMALVQRTAFACIDSKAPDPGAPAPANRAQEEASGSLRFYAYLVSPRDIIDWKEDDRGGFVWLIVDRKEQDRETPFDARDTVRETFTVWTMEGEGPNARAAWAQYVFAYPADKPPRDEDMANPAGQGLTSFRRIPYIRMMLPKGLWVGDVVGQPQKEHWQRRSCLNGAQSRSMASIPFISRGPEIPKRGGPYPSETQEDPERGRDPIGKFNSEGFVEIGSGDTLAFAEPEGRCYELVAKQIDELKDEIFRVTHMMAASVKPSAGTLGRSAASKQQDGKMTALVLRALGKEARDFALAIYRTMAVARGNDVNWIANGLDNYEAIERQDIIAEAISLPMIDIPSETFLVTLTMQIAEKLLTGMDPLTLDTIRREIEAGVKQRLSQKKAEDEARQAALKAGAVAEPDAPKPNGARKAQAAGSSAAAA